MMPRLIEVRELVVPSFHVQLFLMDGLHLQDTQRKRTSLFVEFEIYI